MILWTICNVTPGKTFVSLYETLCARSLELFKRFASELSRTRLVATFVCPAKDNLYTVDSKLARGRSVQTVWIFRKTEV